MSGMQLWMGKVGGHCYGRLQSGEYQLVEEWPEYPCDFSGSEGRECPSGTTCMDSGVNPSYDVLSFDSFLHSFLVIFQVLTLSQWELLYIVCADAAGPYTAAIYYTSLVCLGAYFAVQLIIAVIATKFTQESSRLKLEMIDGGTNFLFSQASGMQPAGSGAPALASKKTLSTLLRELLLFCRSKWRHFRHKAKEWQEPVCRRMLPIVKHKAFEWGVSVCIILNVLTMSISHHGMSQSLADLLEIFEFIFTLVFLLEMACKLLALGLIEYWTDAFDIMDGIVNAFGLVGLVAGGTNLSALRTLRLVRTLRSLRMLTFMEDLRRLAGTIAHGFKSLKDFGALAFLFIFIFIVIGMQMFGGLLEGRRNFDTFGSSFMVLFEMMTGDKWTEIMWKSMDATSDLAAVYFIIWMTLGYFVLATLFLAIFIESMSADGETIQAVNSLDLQLQALLPACPLFVHCTPGNLRQIAPYIQEKEIEAGKPIVTMGQAAGDAIYFVQNGVVEVTSEDGTKSEVLVGGWFGRRNIGEVEGWHISAVTKAATSLWSLTDEDFASILYRFPEVFSHIQALKDLIAEVVSIKRQAFVAEVRSISDWLLQLDPDIYANQRNVKTHAQQAVKLDTAYRMTFFKKSTKRMTLVHSAVLKGMEHTVGQGGQAQEFGAIRRKRLTMLKIATAESQDGEGPPLERASSSSQAVTEAFQVSRLDVEQSLRQPSSPVQDSAHEAGPSRQELVLTSLSPEQPAAHSRETAANGKAAYSSLLTPSEASSISVNSFHAEVDESPSMCPPKPEDSAEEGSDPPEDPNTPQILVASSEMSRAFDDIYELQADNELAAGEPEYRRTPRRNVLTEAPNPAVVNNLVAPKRERSKTLTEKIVDKRQRISQLPGMLMRTLTLQGIRNTMYGLSDNIQEITTESAKMVEQGIEDTRMGVKNNLKRVGTFVGRAVDPLTEFRKQFKKKGKSPIDQVRKRRGHVMMMENPYTDGLKADTNLRQSATMRAVKLQDIAKDLSENTDHMAYTSLGLFNTDSWLRSTLIRIVTSKMFDNCILLLILLSSAVLAVDNPTVETSRLIGDILGIANFVFSVAFIAEFSMKVIAYGFVRHPGSYLRNGWNVLDMAIILVTLPSLLGESSVGALRAFRLMRVLRPLRALSRLKGLQVVVVGLLEAIPSIWHVIIFGLFQTFVFAILGVQLFGGQFHRCNDSSVSHKDECVGRYLHYPTDVGWPIWTERKWSYSVYHFDHMGAAMVSLFIVSTASSWHQISWGGMDVAGV
ncbi:hypothetical protein CYMTET_54311, partial [Cymbomonas tetramitiformis]